jgi:hypothetical protein
MYLGKKQLILFSNIIQNSEQNSIGEITKPFIRDELGFVADQGDR